MDASGFSELLTTNLQNPTVEGDNAILPQQVAKILVKLSNEVHAAKTPREKTLVAQLYSLCDSSYLVHEIPFVHNVCNAKTFSSMRSNTTLLSALAHRSARLLVRVSAMLKRKEWDDCLIEFKRLANAHASYLLLKDFQNTIMTSEFLREGTAERVVMNNLQKLLALWMIERDAGDFCENNYLSLEQVGWVRENVQVILARIRPNAVKLVDARDFSDFRLKSGEPSSQHGAGGVALSYQLTPHVHTRSSRKARWQCLPSTLQDLSRVDAEPRKHKQGRLQHCRCFKIVKVS